MDLIFIFLSSPKLKFLPKDVKGGGIKAATMENQRNLKLHCSDLKIRLGYDV